MMLPAVLLGVLIGPPDAPKKAPKELLAALQSLEVTQGDGGRSGAYQQGFKLTLDAERGRAARADYPLLTSGLLDPGQRVVFTVTVQGTPRVLFDGVITRQELAGDDKPLVTVMGRDLTILMDLTRSAERFPGQGDEDVARAIIGRYSSYGISSKIDSPPTSSPVAEQQRVHIKTGSDLAHLRALAANNGFIFFLRAGPAAMQSQACWVQKERDKPGQKALGTHLAAGTNVDTISFSYDGLAPVKTISSYADPDKDEPTPIQALTRKGGKALSKREALHANAEFVREDRLADTPFDAAQSLARAQAETNRAAERAVKATGTLTTARYGDLLFALGMVDVRGAGDTYDGQYYVDSVTHKLTPDSYTQEFSLSREGTGSTIQKVRAR